MPCNQEEANTRLILHVFDGCRKGYQKLTVVGSDTDSVQQLLLFITFMIWMLMTFGLNMALVSTDWQSGYQYTNMQSNQRKKYVERYRFGMRSQVVTQYLRSVAKVKKTAWDV